MLLVELVMFCGADVVVVEVDVGKSITLCLTAALRGFPLEKKSRSGRTISDFIGVFVLTRILLFCLLFSLLCS